MGVRNHTIASRYSIPFVGRIRRAVWTARKALANGGQWGESGQLR